jgi:hypothetical protein
LEALEDVVEEVIKRAIKESRIFKNREVPLIGLRTLKAPPQGGVYKESCGTPIPHT